MQTATFHDYLSLCKFRVVSLILLTVLVGMLMAAPGWVPLQTVVAGILGIGLAAAAGGAFNQLIDRKVDSKMGRTQNRPIPAGRISPRNALIFATSLGFAGMAILVFAVNVTTAILTFVTLFGYAIIYTVFLKRATSQNIVIGGLAGAMPPLLGWTAVTGQVDAIAWLLVLIIFTWTPPHFWALSVARFKEYKNVNIPMLPVTHGVKFTKLSILLYTLLMVATTLLPFVVGMSGLIYLIAAVLLGAVFLYWAIRLQFTDSVKVAMQTFHFSILYLMLLFIFLLVDHYIPILT